MSDVNTDAAKILAEKIGLLVDQARVIIFVDGYRSFQGEKRLGPLPDVLVKDGWVNRSFILSSGRYLLSIFFQIHTHHALTLFAHHLLGHGAHHVVLLEQAVDLNNGGSAARRYAALAAGV